MEVARTERKAICRHGNVNTFTCTTDRADDRTITTRITETICKACLDDMRKQLQFIIGPD